MKIGLSIFYAAFLASFLFVSSAKADQIDDYVRAQMQEKHIPGAAIAVVKGGRAVKVQTYGLANVELNVPATKDTVFEIGSVSKQMTAAAIMLLVEDGKINLDEKISKYLPNTPESWKSVSVRNLLTHTSGIKSYTWLSGFELSKRMTREEFIKKIAAEPLEFPTGDRYTYSNSGYNLLGYIIESASGKSYWNFMRERIFAPLGMTTAGDRDPQFLVPNRADGYEWANGKIIRRDYDFTDLFAAGAIVATIGDLTKWEAGIAGDKLLKPESKMQIWTPLTFNNGQNFGYGFGWNIADFRNHKLISHGGQTSGFAANISRYVDDKVTIIVLTNNGENGLGGVIARGIAKIEIPAISLRAIKAQTNDDAKISQVFENALRGRVENKLDANLYSAELQKSLATNRQKMLTTKLESLKPLKNFVFIGSEKSGDKQIYRYKVEVGSKLMLWRFSADEGGKITEMTLEEEE